MPIIAPSVDWAVVEATASVFIGIGVRSGTGELRTWALDYAANIDRKLGDSHNFGKIVLERVYHSAVDDYFDRSRRTVPEALTKPGMESEPLYTDGSLKVLHSVMGAYGIDEDEGITIQPIDPRETASSGVAIASFDFSVPGIAYVQHAASVIAWDRSSTLFI